MNAIINHKGVGQVTNFNHLRSAHNLLDYPLSYKSFFERTNIVTWIGPRPKDSMRYRLFKEFGIINWRVLEDQRKVQCRTTGKCSDFDTDTETGPSTKRRRSKKKENAPSIEVVSARPFNPTLNSLASSLKLSISPAGSRVNHLNAASPKLNGNIRHITTSFKNQYAITC